MKGLILFLLLVLKLPHTEREYLKNYYPNGKIMEEGWLENGKKNRYWLFYFDSGLKREEGHYQDDKKTKWWIYYDNNQNILKKCEYKNNVLNGLTIIYHKGRIVAAEKYSMGGKIKTWNTLTEFKKDNVNLFN